MQRILSGSEVLITLIDDLLDMGRVQAGKFSVRACRMNLRGVATQVTERLQPMLDAKTCTYKLDLPPDLPDALGDALRTSQVLSNLITNAIKYSPKSCEIVVEVRVEERYLRCMVHDHGMGIRAEDRARLFLPFEQVDMSAARDVGGVGLGLSIVKTLIEAQGGEVGVEGQPSDGSTFWFTLPIAPSDESSMRCEAPGP